MDPMTECLAKILESGIVNSRYFTAERDIGQATNELEHIHNVPRLIYRYDLQNAHYYYDTERPLHMNRRDGRTPYRFDEHWEALASLLGLKGK